MFLSVIKNIFLRNKKVLYFIFFLFFGFSFSSTFAAGSAGASGSNMGIVDILDIVIRISGTVLALITELVSWFMSPGWTTGRAIGFEDKLKTLWTLVSNIVYLIFAVILVIIATLNIFGKGGEWELKQALPKFIVGVLIVPFSWLIVSAVVGLSSVLTASILSFPMSSFPGVYDSGLNKIPFYKTYIFNIGKSKGKTGEPIEREDPTTFGDFLKENERGIFGFMNIYTYGIMRIDSAGSITSGDVQKGVKTLLNMGIKGIFDVIFILMYFILMVALLMALFVRGIYLWFFMILSPLFGLMYFFGNKGPVEGVSKKFSFKQFISIAMMPVYVAAALSFGLLFILVAGQGMNAEKECHDETTVCYKQEGDASTIKFLGITLKFKGAFSGSEDKKLKEILGGFKGAFGLLVLQVLGLVVLWTGVMGALNSSDLTKEVVAPIQQFGNSVGKLAVKAPSYLPIIPNGQGGMMSAAGLGRFGQSIESHFKSQANASGDQAFSGIFGGGDIPVELKKEIRTLGDRMINGYNKSDINKFRNKFLQIKDLSSARLDPEIRKYLDISAKKFNIKTDNGVFENDGKFAKFLQELNNKMYKESGTGILSNGIVNKTTKDEIGKYFSSGGKYSSSSDSSSDSKKTDTSSTSVNTANNADLAKKITGAMKANKDEEKLKGLAEVMAEVGDKSKFKAQVKKASFVDNNEKVTIGGKKFDNLDKLIEALDKINKQQSN